MIAAPAAAPSSATVVMSRWETTLLRSLKRSRASCFQESRERESRSRGLSLLLLGRRRSGSRVGGGVVVVSSMFRSMFCSVAKGAVAVDVVVVSGTGSAEVDVAIVGVEVAFPSSSLSVVWAWVALRTPFSRSIASITFSSNPFTSLLLRHGSIAIWNIRNRSTFTPIRPHVPHVLIRRILSDQICSSWYRARIFLLSFAAASSASRSAAPRASCASVSPRSLAWSER